MTTETRPSVPPGVIARSCASVFIESPLPRGPRSVCVIPTYPTHQTLENRNMPHGARVPVEEGVVPHGLVNHEDRNVLHDRPVAAQPFPSEVVAKRSRRSRLERIRNPRAVPG